MTKKEDEKEKKTEHTRIVAQLCSSVSEYSRRLLSILAQTQNKINKHKRMIVNNVMQIVFVWKIIVVCKEKKTEHTYMHAQLCSSRAQYSRRLLFILGQP